MKNVVFVAPYFMEATERFILAAATTTDVRLGLVSCDPEEKLPPQIRRHLAGHYRVDGVTADAILPGIVAWQRHLGSVDRLLGMLEQIQEPLGELRDRLGIPGMGEAVARNFRDKNQMKSVFQRHGIPCAAHQLVETPAAAHEFAQRLGFPLVIKPPAGAGSKATYRCGDPGQLATCLQQLRPAPGNPVLLEQFISGEEHSFDSVCLNGQLVWSSISHYAPGPLEVMREPWIQWCVMIPRETEAPRYQHIRQIAGPALKALGIDTGLTHMEWFLQPDGSAMISEVAARPPGAQFTSLLSWAHNLDFYHAWARLMIFDQFDPPARQFAVGAAYLRGMGNGPVERIHGLQQVAKDLGDLIVEAKVPQPGQTPSGSYDGEGHVIVRHPETKVVEQALKRIVTTVRVELAAG